MWFFSPSQESSLSPMNPSFLFTFLQILSFLFFPSIWRNTLRWSTNGDFFQTLGQQWALSPRDIGCYLVPDFTPSAARLVHNNIISKEVCRVFVLQCHSVSHLTCFVSFRRVHRSYAIIQSYSHLQFIQSYKSHSFIDSYNYTFIH